MIPSVKIGSSDPPSKERSRKIALDSLRTLSVEQKGERSVRIISHLAPYLIRKFPDSTRIATFSPLAHEPDLSGLAHQLPEHQFLYPLVLNEEEMNFHFVSDPATLQKGSFGILEPHSEHHPLATLEEIDLVLVPGLAFDSAGNRLGHGKGYYDRFLNQIPTVSTIGITFHSQLVPCLAAEPHDQKVGLLATDQEVIPTNSE